MPKIIINLEAIIQNVFKSAKYIYFIKKYILALGLILGFLAFSALISYLKLDTDIGYIIYFIAFIAIIIFAFKNIKSPKIITRENIIKKIEAKATIEVFDNDKLFGGDIKLWENYKAGLESIKLPKLFIFDWLETKEKIALFICVLALFINAFFLAPHMIFPDILRITGQEVSLNILSENGKIEAGTNLINKNDEIEISFSGAPKIKIKYGNFETMLLQNQKLRLYPNRQENLKIYYFGQRFNGKINFIKPLKPIISGDIDFKIYENGVFGLGFSGENLEQAASLKLIGLLNNTEIKIDKLNNGENKIIIDPRESVLMGQSALIFLKIGSEYKFIGLKKLPELRLRTELAKNLNTLRVNVLKETRNYKKFRQYYDAEFKPINNKIHSAPKSVQEAYYFLNQVLRGNIFEDEFLLNFAYQNLYYADNLNEAKNAASLLWDIIKTDLDTNSLEEVIAAINSLKEAIKENKPPEEIEALKNNLRAKINEHIQKLAENAQNSNETSDSMPNTDGRSIEDIIENAGNNPDSLDSLKEIMKNLALTNGGMDIKSEQSKILENLENASQEKTKDLAKEEEKLLKAVREKLPNNIIGEMQKMQKAMEIGDKDTAKQTGEKIMELLNQNGENNDYDTKSETEIPDEPSINKNRDLIREINKRLENNNGETEERNYLQDILKNVD